MRARSRIALALALALALAAPSSASPSLLVLRAACRDRAGLELAAAAARTGGPRVLSYSETCGAGWHEATTRAALSALSGGGALGWAGWAGTGPCRALTAAALMLRRASPEACQRAAALTRGTARLALALGWRRAALMLTSATNERSAECAALLTDVARELAALGIDARPSHETFSSEAIACSSNANSERGPRLLLLRVGEVEEGTAPPPPLPHPPGRALLLSNTEPDGGGAGDDAESARIEALAALERSLAAEAAGAEALRLALHIYESGVRGAWDRVGTLEAWAEAGLERGVEVRLANLSASARERWSGVNAGSMRTGLRAVGAAALATLAALAALLAALAVRRRAARGGRRGAVLLSPDDFSFPADERRVGEGVETVLSAWLRRLHEFGGPEPGPAPGPAPGLHAPSLPSSTSSVNRVSADRRARYKGDPVHVVGVQPVGAPEPRRDALDVLLVMQSLRHENLNPFIGWLGPRGALVWAHCWRGSLEAVLMEDAIALDWTFRLSLLSDLVKGMRYLHGSPLRLHGRLSSRACAVDSRWVLRVSDYGLPALARTLPPSAPPPPAAARELLWTAPELLRDSAARVRGSQAGDVFSFAIVMQEVIVRGEPYCMLPHTPEELVEKLLRGPPLVRPSVSLGAAPPEAVSVMRRCWSEAPELRPDFHHLHDTFRRLHAGRKINIVDSMFEMLEKYSDNLEELIRERTEQLDKEKKKTEQLLNRMLPRSVAERLLAGERVEPEEFSSVSVYFSDIVGFTALAARSSPVQVVALLNDLYSSFDAAIERYRVYKVETIGDAYMVVGGLPARAPDHAEQVATMALHLLHLAGRFRIRHLPDEPLRLRIGLHSGPVCAAVVGLTMPRYCLFGDTVNTASRMESTGAPGRVQVSGATAARLQAAGGYRLRPRGLVRVKGKGAMRTHWLLGKEGFDKPPPTPPPLESEEALLEMEGESDGEASSSFPPLDERVRARGAASADGSPPRYRRLGARAGAGVGASLRRQWSLERGDALAAAAARQGPLPAREAPVEATPRVAPERYRTREATRPP